MLWNKKHSFSCSLKPKFMLEFVKNVLYQGFLMGLGGMRR